MYAPIPVPCLLRTRIGHVIDGTCVLDEIPMPANSRWAGYVANPDHPATPRGVVAFYVSRVYSVQRFQLPDVWPWLAVRRHDAREIRERWDELQAIKDEIAGPDVWGVEAFPPASRVINVAPMRHIWLLPGNVGLPIDLSGKGRLTYGD